MTPAPGSQPGAADRDAADAVVRPDGTIEGTGSPGPAERGLGELAYRWEVEEPGFGSWGLRAQVPYVMWDGPLPDSVASELVSLSEPQIDILQSNFGWHEMEEASVQLLDVLGGANPGLSIAVDNYPQTASMTVTSSAPLIDHPTHTSTDPRFTLDYVVDPELDFSHPPTGG